MVQMGTKRKVVDNSGVREVRCIRILEGRKKEGGVAQDRPRGRREDREKFVEEFTVRRDEKKRKSLKKRFKQIKVKGEKNIVGIKR